MRLILNRKFLGDEYTIGDLSIDGKFFCNTLEDKYRDLSKETKVWGKTAIPYGIYKVVMVESPKFTPIYGRKVPQIQNVPHFQHILIHAGNTSTDSDGCILVGDNNVKGKVLNSRATLNKLLDILDKETEIILEIK